MNYVYDITPSNQVVLLGNEITYVETTGGTTIRILPTEHVVQTTFGLPGSHIGASWGEKATGIDAGVFGEISLTDDEIFICVKSGAIGTAIWKVTQLVKT